jgi:hypothetical protein
MVDAAHFVFVVFLGSVWFFVRSFIKTLRGRQRYSLMGAVDSQRQEAIKSSTPGNIETPDVCDLLQLISNHHPEVLITPIMNNLTRLFRPPP